eukprot:CAMPEP_0204349698 /NCGR_PEP_ID=MMETSP0469-20131031/29732_1 /ASSEMBLY_ACC=CAM_ASM_000384 /TAXON_ID=2969 /ORGANISM="Oxyrrhis marina" /LENGTH=352 /DNA_ID=CAMNT_0051335931 /DNA_START=34 /DNA_END=1089 /DNA_ORIENTATION=+
MPCARGRWSDEEPEPDSPVPLLRGTSPRTWGLSSLPPGSNPAAGRDNILSGMDYSGRQHEELRSMAQSRTASDTTLNMRPRAGQRPVSGRTAPREAGRPPRPEEERKRLGRPSSAATFRGSRAYEVVQTEAARGVVDKLNKAVRSGSRGERATSLGPRRGAEGVSVECRLARLEEVVARQGEALEALGAGDPAEATARVRKQVAAAEARLQKAILQGEERTTQHCHSLMGALREEAWGRVKKVERLVHERPLRSDVSSSVEEAITAVDRLREEVRQSLAARPPAEAPAAAPVAAMQAALAALEQQAAELAAGTAAVAAQVGVMEQQAADAVARAAAAEQQAVLLGTGAAELA